MQGMLEVFKFVNKFYFYEHHSEIVGLKINYILEICVSADADNIIVLH